jgi:hypothetical protein
MGHPGLGGLTGPIALIVALLGCVDNIVLRLAPVPAVPAGAPAPLPATPTPLFEATVEHDRLPDFVCGACVCTPCEVAEVSVDSGLVRGYFLGLLSGLLLCGFFYYWQRAPAVTREHGHGGSGKGRGKGRYEDAPDW